MIVHVVLNCYTGSAYLAQSPQLYKQMAIASDFERVFTVGAGKKSVSTTRWLLNFVGLFIIKAWVIKSG